MSQLQEFLQLIGQDTQLQQKLADATNVPSEVVKLGKTKGYSFTAKDVEEWIQSQEELGEEELESVAGGRRLNLGRCWKDTVWHAICLVK